MAPRRGEAENFGINYRVAFLRPYSSTPSLPIPRRYFAHRLIHAPWRSLGWLCSKRMYNYRYRSVEHALLGACWWCPAYPFPSPVTRHPCRTQRTQERYIVSCRLSCRESVFARPRYPRGAMVFASLSCHFLFEISRDASPIEGIFSRRDPNEANNLPRRDCVKKTVYYVCVCIWVAVYDGRDTTIWESNGSCNRGARANGQWALAIRQFPVLAETILKLWRNNLWSNLLFDLFKKENKTVEFAWNDWTIIPSLRAMICHGDRSPIDLLPWTVEVNYRTGMIPGHITRRQILQLDGASQTDRTASPDVQFLGTRDPRLYIW